MRRTYRSKKDASGALDHKDVLLTMDEKSSAFDAFFIQNIKQTKREMSSVNFRAAPPSKVRKRKYVKRIVKDPEPSKESALESVYLTPNKSLHVNKPMDPFDQLLNSPSTNQNDSFKVNRGGLFGYKNEAKTYNKRKTRKLKKFNYSSETSESEKENLDNCKTPDTSNILKHELFIEKKDIKKSPTSLDKSIKDLVQNFSLLRKSSPKTPGKLSQPFKFVNHRLTTNIKSPISQVSPLCSTPFKAKYRGASIYQISPISTKVCNESLDNKSSQNNSNDSIIFVDKSKQLLSFKEENKLSTDVCKSPVFKTPDNYKLPSISVKDCNQHRDKSNSLYKASQQTSIENIDKILVVDNVGTDKLEEPAIVVNECEQSNNKVISSIELSSLQTTEIEPFLGFSVIQNVSDTYEQKELDDSLQNHEIVAVYSPENDKNDNKDLQTSLKTLDSTNNSDASHYNHSLENSVMLFSNDNSLENELNEDCGSQQDDSAMISQLLEEDEEKKYVPANFSQSLMHSKNSSQNSIESDVSEVSEDKSSSSHNSDNQSLYDTCDSGDISQNDSRVYFSKLPIVEVERLNDSVFQKYYSKMADTQLENSDSCQDSEDYESVDNISDQSNNADANTSISENLQEDCYLDTSKDSSDDNDTDSNSNTDEDRCISFVTTRRRNEVNDSMFLTFNDSNESVSSLECDKTVLSNRNSGIKTDLSDNEAILVNDQAQSPILTISADIKKDRGRSTVTTRKSARESLLKEEELKNVEFKPSIVLQPGKKWERSLSIYRRMTMMNDHFDHSALEEEPLQTKGRKYRQSVISTMQMQDQGLLHNESINSRRSTFISKPCRSTIRIVKEPNNSRISLCATAVLDDLTGFLNEDCDDTIVELSKLSIADSEHEVTVLETFHDTAGRVATARDYVLRRCNQTEVLLFDECYPDTVLKNCHKIGEGVYGEVFLWRARDGRARVMKIVPIAGTTKVNGESQKDFHEIISEIVIAMELSALRAPIAEINRHFDEGKDIDALDLHSVENATDVFNEVLAVRCVYGSYPSRLLDLWELYDECKGSENDNPAILPVDQQYIVLELANAGQDLESYQFNSAEQAHALFLQVAFALAVGEESFQFEHRDLHWGNVLISPTDQKFATFVLRGRAHRVPRCGVAATIIDYSLSRLSLPLAHSDCAALYNDLAEDDGLFDALGDYQFEVYRRMRDKLGNDWKNFEPYTNILWLHYTVDKMITALRYKRTNTKIHKHYIAKLKGIKNRILDYGSAAQFVLTDNEF